MKNTPVIFAERFYSLGKYIKCYFFSSYKRYVLYGFFSAGKNLSKNYSLNVLANNQIFNPF